MRVRKHPSIKVLLRRAFLRSAALEQGETAAVPRAPLIHVKVPLSQRAQWDAPNLLLSTLVAGPVEMPFTSLFFDIRKPVTRQPESAFEPLLPWLAEASTPFVSRDFGSRPRLAQRRDESFIPQMPEAGVVQPPFVAVDWLTQPHVNTRPSSDAPNLLGSTLALAPETMPFRLSDWPKLGRVERRPIFYPGRTVAPAAAAQAPHVSYDWLLRPRAHTRKAFDPQNLIDVLTQPPAVTPFSVIDWSMRPQRGERQDFAPHNLLPSLLQFVAGTPFVSIDWQPRAKVRTPRPFLLAREYEEQNVATPFNVQDWSRRPRAGIREDVAQQNLIGYLTYNYGMPFSMHDWSTRSRAHLRQEFIQQNLSMLQTIDYGTPFSSYDWTVKPRAHARQSFDSQNILGLLTSVLQRPFFLIDWSTNTRSQSRQTAPDQSLLALRTALAASPFAQLDWSYPEFRSTPKPHWDVDLLLHLLQTIHVKPFAQHDWTVRDRVRQPAREQTWDYGLAFTLFQHPALMNLVNILLHVSPRQLRNLSVTVNTDEVVHVSPRIDRNISI